MPRRRSRRPRCSRPRRRRAGIAPPPPDRCSASGLILAQTARRPIRRQCDRLAQGVPLALKLLLQAAATRLWVLVPLAIVLGLGPSRRALAEMAPQCQPAQSLRLSAEPPPPGT